MLRVRALVVSLLSLLTSTAAYAADPPNFAGVPARTTSVTPRAYTVPARAAGGGGSATPPLQLPAVGAGATTPGLPTSLRLAPLRPLAARGEGYVVTLRPEASVELAPTGQQRPGPGPQTPGATSTRKPERVEVVDAPADHWFTPEEWARARANGFSRPYTQAEKDQIRGGDFTAVQVGGQRGPRVERELNPRAAGPAALGLPPLHGGLSLEGPRRGSDALPAPTAPAGRSVVPSLPALTPGSSVAPRTWRPTVPARRRDVGEVIDVAPSTVR